jgi:polysaccharide chain length determinant protein (PEP-CTERM system associated)
MADNIQTDAEELSSHPGLLPLSILRTVWKRRARIVAAWALFALVTVAVVRQLPPVYLAESVVLIDSQKIPENFVSATVASDLEERVAAVRQMLLSGGELRKVINEFGLYQEERKTHAEEEILEMMRKHISITIEAAGPGKRPGTFRIGYQGPDPAIVMRVANRLTDLYVERNLQTREGHAEGASAFLDSELRVAKNRLDELEAAVSSYKVKYNGELPEQEASLSRALSELHTQLQANMDALNRGQQTKVVQESTLSAMEASAAVQTVRALEPVGREGEAGVTTTPAPSRTYRKASEALEAQLAELLTKVTEEHPAAIKLRTAIETAKREEELEHSRESGLKAQIEVTEKELRELTANQRRILRDLEGYQHRIERLPVREQEMAQITRDYEMSKTNYKSLLDKKMAAEMALDMERRQQAERFIVLDRARLPAKPLKPERPLLYAGGSVVGLALALLLGFIAELRQNVILGEWELKDDIPVLARLPQFEIPHCSSQTASPAWRRLFSRNRRLSSTSTT